MNFSDDLEENLSIIIKWLMLVSLVVIVLWGVVNIFKSMFSKPDANKQQTTTTETTNNDYLTKTDDEVAQELQDLESSPEDELTELLPNEDAVVQHIGDKTFILNVKELPEKLFFGLTTSNSNYQKRQDAVNKKVGVNYIDSVLSYGSLVRWNPASFPLKIYIEKNPNVPHNHVNELKSAFAKWQECTNNFISFVYVNDKANADIVCTYPENFTRTCESAESSETSRQFFTYDEEGHIEKANIELTYRDCNGQKYADDLVYAFTLKEVGHALGLRGHSGMFQGQALFYSDYDQSKGRPEIHSADINTLKLVYSLMPDKTDADFTEEQVKKLIRPEEVWGDKVERTPHSEKTILYNIEKTPEIPALHISLANYYSEKGEYDKALEVYSRSIILLNEAEMKARVYVRVGDTFTSQYRYMEAAEAYKLSLKNLNKKQNLYDVYFNLGYIYFQQGKYEESLNSFQSALQYAYSKDTFYRLLMNLSQVYLKTNNLENATKCAEKALSLRKTPRSQYITAYTKYLNEDIETAQVLLEEIIEKVDYPLAYALLAQIYYKTEQFEDLQTLSDSATEIFEDKTPFVFK